MKIIRIEIANFRALRSIVLPTDSAINVIVGPNGVGKSTLLEAVRLTKVLLAARMNNEAQSVLVQMGALSQHNQAIGAPGVDISALTNDPALPITIKITIHLGGNEIDILWSEVHNLAMLTLQSQTINAGIESPLAFTQFLSTDAGKTAYETIIASVTERLQRLTTHPLCALELTMSHSARTIAGKDSFDQSFITLLDRRLPIHKAVISSFPADRAFPAGEQPIQVGAADAIQQLQAHMALPSNKYARLKQTIIHNIMLVPDGRKTITDEFNLIFDHFLPGKRLSGIHLNPLGLLKILVEDTGQGKTFDIDQMSSGEKGLVLTFLFIRLSMERNGIVLLDEPELHLNAAVQAKLLSFIQTHCVDALSLQVFLCTHSPEVVRDAFDKENCELFHLRDGDDLTPILRQDQRELFDVFERLGSSPADVLFTRGNVYVEGEHDAAVLQAGFPVALSGVKVTAVGGRGEIEREVPILQAEDKAKRLKKIQLFILDNDRVQTKLVSSEHVIIHQHSRYCLENYLLDADIIFDLLSAHATKSAGSRGAFPRVLENIALLQTDEQSMRHVYAEMAPESPGMRGEDCKGKTFEEVSDILSQRLSGIKDALKMFDKVKWKSEFVARCVLRKSELESEWRTKWQTVCNAKTIIDELYVRYQISMKKVEFKKQIMLKMAEKMTDDWRIINDVLISGLK